MKITWKGTNYGQIGFHVELDEYDATPPVKALLMDQSPIIRNAEREAIAAYLAFGRWVSGDLHLPHKCGPNTAAAIEQDLVHVQVRPGPIEYYPKPLEIGIRDVSVRIGGHPSVSDLPSIQILRSSEWSGSVRGLQSIAVASNAFALDSFDMRGVLAIRAQLAVAVLFAADLSADTLVLPSSIPLAEKTRLTALLLAARLGARFEQESGLG